jgi:2EXR family
MAQAEGVEVVRNTTVPAYTFTQFGNLPVEIRASIWSLATRVEEPQIYSFFSMAHDESRLFPRDGSSRIFDELPEWPQRKQLFPSVLHACHESRSVASEIYSIMPVKYLGNNWAEETYFNTLYDSFYMGGDPWNDFKILVDILISWNTTRSLRTHVRKQVEQLKNIRNLIVDLNIFGAVPVRLWAEFPKLETLTIAFYGYSTIKEEKSWGRKPRDLHFTEPRPGKYQKRCEWVVNSVRQALEAAKRENLPEWKLPTIRAVLRRVDEDFDEVDYGSDEESTDEDSLDEGNKGDSGYDDSIWYQHAAARMVHDVPKQEIRRLKRQHLPTLKVGMFEVVEGKKFGDWLTDSEAEGRDSDVDRSYAHTHEFW